MSLTLTVHRGAHDIGGNCVEIVHPDGTRLLIDAGRPLDAPEGVTGLLPDSLDLSGPATVLISHPHQDHYGLLNELPATWPVWTGEASARLIGISGAIGRQPLPTAFRTWTSRCCAFEIGGFTVTPILTDHSAFDAYMLLVEGAGRRILYTGDFRRHGRKASVVDAVLSDPPRNVDVLLIEGTNLGTDKPVVTEASLEDDFVTLFARTKGRVFVTWSAQNIDRTVTLYRAAKRTGRTLVIDLYTADVLDQIADGTRLPRPGFPNLKVVVTARMGWLYAQSGRDDFIKRMARHGLAASHIPTDAVVMVRRSLIPSFEKAGIVPTDKDAFNFSMWRGYVKVPAHAEVLEWCRAAGSEIATLHTSGHASPADLRALAAAVAPRAVVPIHGANWDTDGGGFANIRRLTDGERMEL